MELKSAFERRSATDTAFTLIRNNLLLPLFASVKQRMDEEELKTE